MSLSVPNFSDKYKFWFYFRKALFQAFFPILLAFMSLCDFAKQNNSDDGNHAYNYLYFYTLTILFLYTAMKQILEFIFNVCADDVVFKKEINMEQTTSQLLLPINKTKSAIEKHLDRKKFEENTLQFSESNYITTDQDHQNNSQTLSTTNTLVTTDGHFFITIKKIFKLRYSKSPPFAYISKLCWFLGIDCPILIPANIISKLGNVKEEITLENEQEFLHTTLMNLYAYHPKLYEITPITHVSDDGLTLLEEGMVPELVITRIDKSICDMQYELFGKENEIDAPNVV